ncbi:MAG: cadherin-like domain-containing protein, partial [Planctomycetota bacterium]|nr:cadherin-like domain-containing protein [Planctomycetota bacterium]
TPITINVLGNDTDVDGDVLSIVSFEQPSNAVVTEVDGQLRVEPALDFHGVINFSYTTIDAQGGQSTATVEVTVLPVNDTPLAVADAAEVAEDTPITINVLGNDVDVDGDVLSIVSFEQPDNAVVTEVDGQLRVEPAADQLQLHHHRRTRRAINGDGRSHRPAGERCSAGGCRCGESDRRQHHHP